MDCFEKKVQFFFKKDNYSTLGTIFLRIRRPSIFSKSLKHHALVILVNQWQIKANIWLIIHITVIWGGMNVLCLHLHYCFFDDHIFRQKTHHKHQFSSKHGQVSAKKNRLLFSFYRVVYELSRTPVDI